MSTCLSHLWPERGPMISGTAGSVSDAEMLEAVWTQAILEGEQWEGIGERVERWFEDTDLGRDNETATPI